MRFLDRIRGISPQQRTEMRLLSQTEFRGQFEVQQQLDKICTEIDLCIRRMYPSHEFPSMSPELLDEIEQCRQRKSKLEAEHEVALQAYLQPYFDLSKLRETDEQIRKMVNSQNFTEIGWMRMRTAMNWGKNLPDDWRTIYRAGSEYKE